MRVRSTVGLGVLTLAAGLLLGSCKKAGQGSSKPDCDTKMPMANPLPAGKELHMAEFALESARWQNGVFTYAVLQGLTSGDADTDRDGTVRVSELRDYVVGEVHRLTRGAQTPTSRRENLEFDFPAVSRGCREPPGAVSRPCREPPVP